MLDALNRTGTNRLRLFEEMRLHPWNPEQKKIIDGQIAMLMVEAPAEGEEYRQKYDDKMAKHISENAPLAEPSVEAAPVAEEPKAEEAPKKRGRKAKITSPLAE